MKRHEKLVDLEANALDIADSHQSHQEIRAWREEQLHRVLQFEEEQASNHYQSVILWLKLNETEQLAIFDSLSAEGAKHPGTCSWLPKHTKAGSWLQHQPERPVLWLEGVLESGKSVISTQLLVRHFCTSAYSSSLKHEQFLKSLLSKLLARD